MKTEKNNVTKRKKHFDFGKNAVRIIALLLAIMMIVAAGATVLFYIVFNARG